MNGFNIVQVIGSLLEGFPWSGMGLVLTMLYGGVFFQLLFFLIYGVIRRNASWKKKENYLSQIPQGAAAWTIHKSNPWVKLYQWYWTLYPRDICTYFWKSLVLFIFFCIVVVSACAILLSMVSLLCWFGYAMWLFILACIQAISQFPRLVLWMLNTMSELAAYPKAYLIAGLLSFVVAVFLFFRSNTGRVTCLRIKAWKRGVCPLIRIDD